MLDVKSHLPVLVNGTNKVWVGTQPSPWLVEALMGLSVHRSYTAREVYIVHLCAVLKCMDRYAKKMVSIHFKLWESRRSRQVYLPTWRPRHFTIDQLKYTC